MDRVLASKLIKCFAFQPIAASTKPKSRVVLLLIFFTWVFSVTLAFVPIAKSFQHKFVTKADIPDLPFFNSSIVEFSSECKT